MRIANFLAGLGMTAFGATAAVADDGLQGLEVIGVPVDRGLNFQQPVTELMHDLIWLDNFLLYIITAISVFVMILMGYCIVRYNQRSNDEPATFTHNSKIEVAWTVIPIIILIAMIPPSLKLLRKQQIMPEGDVVIKATGHQWYWNHEYVDLGFGFDSYMIGGDDGNRLTAATEAQLKEAGYSKDEFLLATDTAVVVPVNKDIVIQVTGADVIHAWTIPAFGVKQDAVPGRIAELWFNVEKEGVYFGQCSELCGLNHAYMPITVKVVAQDVYEKWVGYQQCVAEQDEEACADKKVASAISSLKLAQN